MNISILITSKEHPIFPFLVEWIENNNNNQISLVHSVENLSEGDLLFLISYSELVSKKVRNKFQKTLVIHASDLPHGRGWSPHIWQVANGETEVTVTLLEAEDKVDTGDIWCKMKIHIPPTALYNEINQLIFQAEFDLMDYALTNFLIVRPELQDNEVKPSYWPKRSPKDSELDISKSINDLFNLLRVCDPDRFPAYFMKDSRKYLLKIEADDEV